MRNEREMLLSVGGLTASRNCAQHTRSKSTIQPSNVVYANGDEDWVLVSTDTMYQ